MVEVKLNGALYPTWAVQRAMADYAGLAIITAEDNGEYCICHFDGCRYDESLTMREFLNYLIDLLNSGGGKRRPYEDY